MDQKIPGSTKTAKLYTRDGRFVGSTTLRAKRTTIDNLPQYPEVLLYGERAFVFSGDESCCQYVEREASRFTFDLKYEGV